MADPLLSAHTLLPRLYLLGSPLTPISIRDQMLRATWLVDRLASAGMVSNDHEILVVGAGAAGATAAIRAAQHGARVLLVEENGGPFGVQARSSTRWVDPSQHDWPALHWSVAKYPWKKPAVPLPFAADFSDQLARRWSALLHLHIAAARAGALTYQANTRVMKIRHSRTGTLDVDLLVRRAFPVTHAFTLILWAVGFGDEKVTIPRGGPGRGTIAGPPFWSTDTIKQPNCGHPSRAPRVLILGGGDGALQDFLRVATTQDSAADICHALKLPATIRREVLEIEGHFHRSLVWCERNGPDEGRLYAGRDDRYRDIVAKLWLKSSFQASLSTLLRTDIASIAVAFPTAYLTGFYGLNCFLAHAIAQAWKHKRGKKVLLGGMRANHGQAKGGGFEVELDNPPGAPINRQCDVLLIRLGIDPAKTMLPYAGKLFLPALERTRHLFPFHLPG